MVEPPTRSATAATTSARRAASAASTLQLGAAKTGVKGVVGAPTKSLAGADTRKRKRGALQDISNDATLRSTATGTNVTARGTKKPLTKPLTKPPTTTSTTTSRLRAATTASAAAGRSRQTSSAVATRRVGTKGPTPAATNATNPTTNRRAGDGPLGAKRRKHEDKIQTSLLSFQGLANSKAPEAATAEPTTTTTTTHKEEEPQHPQDEDSQATLVVDIECSEAMPEDTETGATASATTTAVTTGEMPPYLPRPYVFQFDHHDSGFDEETYNAQIRDIDEPHRCSAIHCTAISRELDRYHRQHETKYMPEPTYIGSLQLDINEKMRTILVDWLVEVGEEYELDSQTFHKAVNLVDRCLAKFKINRKQFQLLGCACMMIAAKFEEVYGPNVDEFVYISDQTYTSDEMLEMESKVLAALEYRIASTTCYGFLQRFMRAGCEDEKQKALVKYLCDFALLYYHMLKYRPSQVAASAIYLARLMTGVSEGWTPTLHHFTQYNPWDLKDCILDLFRLHHAENEIVQTQRDKAKAISEKYLADKYQAVGAIPAMDEAALDRSFLAYTPRSTSSSSTDSKTSMP